MPCACDQCLQHATTLGLPQSAPSKAAIHKAYRQAAKLWHPDRHANDPRSQIEAEDRFKKAQHAYQALTDHHDNPVELPPQAIFAKPVEPPPLSFGNAPGCFTAPQFTPYIQQVIATHLGLGRTPVAIIDLTRPGPQNSTFSQFLLLDSHSVIVRGTLGVVSFLWYTDLGEIKIVDRRRNGKLPFWQKLVEKFLGPRQNYILQIYRRNGTHFYTLAETPDDSVKKVIYNFLLREKHDAHH
jgi:hypothetical protein